MASGTNKCFARATKQCQKAMESLSVRSPQSPEEKMDCGQILTTQPPPKPLFTLTAAPMEVDIRVANKKAVDVAVNDVAVNNETHKPEKPVITENNKENVSDSVRAYRMAMNLVGTLVDGNFNIMDTCLKSYIPLMTNEGKSYYLAAMNNHKGKEFSDVMRELQGMDKPPGDSISHAIEGDGAFRYMSITVDIFLEGLRHTNPNLAHDAKQILNKMEDSARLILETQKKIKLSEEDSDQTPSLRKNPELGEITDDNQEVIDEYCDSADDVLNALSSETQRDREDDPVLQHYSKRVHRILSALENGYKP